MSILNCILYILYALRRLLYLINLSSYYWLFFCRFCQFSCPFSVRDCFHWTAHFYGKNQNKRNRTPTTKQTIIERKMEKKKMKYKLFITHHSNNRVHTVVLSLYKSFEILIPKNHLLLTVCLVCRLPMLSSIHSFALLFRIFLLLHNLVVCYHK